MGKHRAAVSTGGELEIWIKAPPSPSDAISISIEHDGREIVYFDLKRIECASLIEGLASALTEALI